MSTMETSQPADPLPSQVVSTLTGEAREHWRLTGEIKPELSAKPDKRERASAEPDSSTDADSSPAEPDIQAAEIAASTQTASEPVASKPKKNAETRIKELLAQTKALEAENARLKTSAAPQPKTDDKPAASSPAPETKRTLSAVVDSPDLTKPAMTDLQFFTEFPEATAGDYVDYKFNHRDGLKSQKDESTKRVETVYQQYQDRAKPVFEANEGLWDDLPETFKNAKPTGISKDPNDPTRTPFDDATALIMRADDPGKFLLHFREHPEEFDALGSLKTADDVVYALGRLEGTLTTSVKPTPAVRTRTVSAAPESGTTLGRKAQTAPIDDVAHALKTRDMGTYKAIMNRRDAERASR